MRQNQLVLAREREKYAHIFDNIAPSESVIKAPTHEELDAEQKMQTTNEIASFFGIEGDFTMEDFVTSYVEPIASEVEDMYEKNVMKEEDLTARTAEENEKRFEESTFIFKRKLAENAGLTEPAWSKSNDYVVTGDEPGYAQKLSGNRFKEMDRSLKRGMGHSNMNANRMNNFSNNQKNGMSNKTQKDGKARPAMERLGDFNEKMQYIGSQSVRGWDEPVEESYYEKYANNVPWWKKGMRKVKNFFKSRKGKITMKFGSLVGLNMAMAVFSKKYEFEDGKQMVAMFGFMLTSFFLTRELTEDGIDVRGFGF